MLWLEMATWLRCKAWKFLKYICACVLISKTESMKPTLRGGYRVGQSGGKPELLCNTLRSTRVSCWNVLSCKVFSGWSGEC